MGQAQKEALMSVKLGVCPWCGEVLEWDLTDPNVIAILEEIINSQECHNGPCLEGRRRCGR